MASPRDRPPRQANWDLKRQFNRMVCLLIHSILLQWQFLWMLHLSLVHPRGIHDKHKKFSRKRFITKVFRLWTSSNRVWCLIKSTPTSGSKKEFIIWKRNMTKQIAQKHSHVP